MTDNIINNGKNQLYNQIFCNFLTNTNGFSTCKDCNYNSLESYETEISTNEDNCLTSCKNDTQCTSYIYNTSNGYCDKYNTFPNQIYSNPGTNSGYNLNFTYDFNDLSSNQQFNVKKKCATQYVDNYFNLDNIDIANCMSINDSGINTVFNIDETCLANVYSNAGISINSTNSNVSNDTTPNTGIISDSIIDNYITEYDKFLEDDVPSPQTLSPDYTSYWTQTMVDRTDQVLQTQPEISQRSGIDSGFKENFENSQNSSNGIKFLAFFIIIIIFIILFYAFNKK